MLISEVQKKMKEYTEILRSLYGENEEERVIRTAGNPIGDYGEWLASKKLELVLYNNSEKSFDAYKEVERTRINYQIKSRQKRIFPDSKGKQNLSRTLGIIRKYDESDTENKYLIAMFFDYDFSVLEGYQIPYKYLKEIGTENSHQNGIVVNLSKAKIKKLIGEGKMKDITEQLKGD